MPKKIPKHTKFNTCPSLLVVADSAPGGQPASKIICKAQRDQREVSYCDGKCISVAMPRNPVDATKGVIANQRWLGEGSVWKGWPKVHLDYEDAPYSNALLWDLDVVFEEGVAGCKRARKNDR